MKHYLTAEEIADQEEKKKREQEWKVYNYHKILITDIITQKKKGLGSREDQVDEDDSKGATGGGTNMDLEEKEQDIDEEEEEEEESSSDEDVRLLQQYVVLSLLGIVYQDIEPKGKGVSHLIEIENPNRVQQKGKKVQNIDVDVKVELSRRERYII